VGYNLNYKWINPTKIPFITEVIIHLLSGMSHQVGKTMGNPLKMEVAGKVIEFNRGLSS
jgi:hypothetical protein